LTTSQISKEKNEIFETEVIDATTARQYLETSTHNRRINPERVLAYSKDMAADKWHLHGAAIQFDKDGHLIDGHHRLWAVIKSGNVAIMLVARNIDPAAQKVIDRGQSRAAHQTLQFSGLDLNKFEVAIARAMRLNCQSTKFDKSKQNPSVSAEEEFEFCKRYYDAIKFAGKVYAGSGKGCASSAIRSVVARAHLTQGTDLERLVNFVFRIDTGEPGDSNTDDAARLLREYHLFNRGKNPNVVEQIQKGAYALKFYLDKRSPTSLRLSKEDPFTICEI
jgi:riboflavin synthase alpha subunit